MSQYYNLHPPALLFTNDGIYSPNSSHLDQYGVPDSINNPLMQLIYDANLIGFIGEGPLAATRPPEKRYLYSTFFDEIILWCETIKANQKLDITFEDWILPNGNLVQMPTQLGGTQFDGLSLHNPEFWRVWNRNIGRVLKGKELTQSEITTINATTDAEFPDGAKGQTGIFGRGKIQPAIAPWVFPFGLSGNFIIPTRHYRYISYNGDWNTTGTANTAGNSGPNHVGAGYSHRTLNVFGDEEHHYGFTLLKFYTDFMEKGKTLRQMFGEFAIALEFNESKTYYPNITGEFLPPPGPGGYRLGLHWSIDVFPSWDQQPSPENQVSWFNQTVAGGTNVISIPANILDEPSPNPDYVPYFMLAPASFGDVPEHDTSAGLKYDHPDEVNLGPADTGYAHNYPCRQHAIADYFVFARLCSDEVYMQW